MPTKNDGGLTKPKENTGKGTLAKMSKKVYIKKKRLTSIQLRLLKCLTVTSTNTSQYQ